MPEPPLPAVAAPRPIPTRPIPAAPAATTADPVAAAVAALPALPPDEPGNRYGERRLTVTWLAGFAAPTRTAYFRDLADFLGWCQRQGLDPRRARSSDIDHYRAGLRYAAPTGGGLSPATVHRRLSALSSWYRYLLANGEDGQPRANPVAGVRRPRVDRDASTTAGLTTEEVRALLQAADRHAAARTAGLTPAAGPQPRARALAALRDRALVRLLADLGLRVGEALRLDTGALAHNQGRRTVRFVGKGGKLRERPLSAHVLAALDDYLAARAEQTGTRPDQLAGPLFATTGRGGRAGRLTEPAVFRLIRSLAGDAGLPSAQRLSPHSLRHAFATNAREIGVPLEDVQDAMGHADARTTRRYDRGRYALQRDPALRLSEMYGEH